MYRRVNSGRFIVVTTAGIMVVMAIFTWVMYGMAQQVFTMTDVMVELNQSFKSMVVTQTSMANDIHAMSGDMRAMKGSINAMQGDIHAMTGGVASMADGMQRMNMAVSKMTYDVGQATYAVSHPMSYMWGNPFPF